MCKTTIMRNALIVACIHATLNGPAGAATIMLGDLTRNTETPYIIDSLNNRTWLGWDITKQYSFEQTLDETKNGGLFDGFIFANYSDAQLFGKAAFKDATCTPYTYQNCHYFVQFDAGLEQLVGESYIDFRGLGNYYDVEHVFFLSEPNGIGGAGKMAGGYNNFNGLTSLQIDNNWGSISSTHAYLSPTIGIGWLLYKPSSHIPEPTVISLIALGLMIFGFLRRANNKI